MAIADEFAENLKRSNLDLAIFLRIEVNPVARFWVGGIGYFPVAADNIETDASEYVGLGDVSGLPAFQSLINGKAERLEFTFSGLPPETVALAKAEAQEIRGAPVNIGFMGLDEQGGQGSALYWLGRAQADMVTCSRENLGDGSYLRSVTISAGTANTQRRRPLLRFFTDAFQRLRSADDRFCERVNRYSIGSTIKWPR